MPTQTSKVRRGDVGRVMAFAMEHAEGGMGEEVVDVLVSNVLSPLQFTKASKSDYSDAESSADEGAPKPDPNEMPDTSPAKIIALWLISDVLSNSSLGVRAAWRYRQLFDTALRERGVFRHLGDIYRSSGWGRMKAEKFRRGVVEGVLEGWEKWCIFPQSSQETFIQHFLNPEDGLSPEQQQKGAAAAAAASAAGTGAGRSKSGSGTPAEKGLPKVAKKSGWKTVEAMPSAFDPQAAPDDDDVDGKPMEADDVDGEPMDEDVDGEPMVDDDVDGEPMVEDDVDGVPMAVEENGEEKREGSPPPKESRPSLSAGFGVPVTGFKMGGGGGATGNSVPKRKRPKAEDMFADDDDD